MKAIWITWEHQVRNLSMAKAMEAEYQELIYGGNKIIRYLVLSIKTYIILFKRKPDIVFFQNPSIVLSIVCVSYKLLSFNRVIIVGDFHNSALDSKVIVFYINKIVARRCNLVIVTNNDLFKRVVGMGGKPYVFPDPLPIICENNTDQIEGLKDTRYILLISSWASDEPIENVCNAYLRSSFSSNCTKLVITGNFNNKKIQKMNVDFADERFFLTGYVTNSKYQWLVKNSIFNMDLTTRGDCMVCGGYESLSARKPVMLSNNRPTMDYFTYSAVYTDNSIDDIIKKMEFMVENIPEIMTYIDKKKNELAIQEIRNSREIKKVIIQHKCSS